MWEGWDSQPSPTLPTEAPDSQQAVKLAFCPLLFLAEGVGLCGDVCCRTCAHLENTFADKATAWLCTKCSEAATVSHPFWSDGHCDACGYESSVLVLVEL